MTKSILVVEDSTARRVFVEQCLRDEGYETRWTDASSLAWQALDRRAFPTDTNDVRIAWEPLGTSGYSLMVLDVCEIRREPFRPAVWEEGLRLLRRVRGDSRFSRETLPVIGMTHHLPNNADTYKEEFFDCGGNEYLEWPFNVEKLLGAVEQLIGMP